MSKVAELPSVLQQLILCSVLHCSRYSESIARELMTILPNAGLSLNSITSTLNNLVKAGLIKSHKVDPGIRLCEYSITELGRKRCKAEMKAYIDLVKRSSDEQNRRIHRDRLLYEENRLDFDVPAERATEFLNFLEQHFQNQPQ